MSAIQDYLRRIIELIRQRSSRPAGDLWRLSVRSKFLIMMLLTSLLSLGAITWLAYRAGKEALTEAAVNHLTSVRAAKKQQVEFYFRSMRDSFRAVADAPIVVNAIEEFTAAFRALEAAPRSPERLKKLEHFYRQEFLPRLAKNLDVAPSFDDYFPTLGAMQELQLLYIAENPHKIGDKANLTNHGQGTRNAYTIFHERYHGWFHGLALKLNLYDLFLIDGETGTIVYSVTKETDLGQNATGGPVAGTNLGQLIREVTRSRRPWDTRYSDFAFYPPSYNIPAGFIAAPVFKDRSFVGILAGQISTEALAKFMHDDGKWREQGLGNSGAVYLIGADMTMRSDTREIVEIPDKYVENIKRAGVVTPAVAARIKSQRTTILHYPIQNAPVRNALLGRTGTETIVNRRGFGALMSYAPLDIPDLKWVIIARMDENEVLAAQQRFNRNVMIAACSLALLSALAALWLAGLFLRPMQALLAGIERLSKGERGVVIESRSRDEFNDLVGAFNSMSATIKQRDEVIEGKTRSYEQLLKRIFPEAVAARMRQGEASIAEAFARVTVVYVIIDGFAVLAERRGSEASVKLLNEIVDRLDTVAEDQGLEKVKTIGDHYLAMSSLTATRFDHARRALEFCRRAWREISAINLAQGLGLGLRAGIATGPAHAGLVGSRRFVFDVWGRAPSIARRIVYDADLRSVRLNAEAYAEITDKAGLADELTVKTKTLGPIQTWQLRLTPAVEAKAAE